VSTYVLVHGAWHGGWCWRRVRRALEADGSAVYTPTLTGLGDRAHLLSREVGLETHIADVLAVLETEDLADVVLVGHSYAGMVVTAVADRAAARIARLVYLDAVVPRDGQCLYDTSSPQVKAHFEEQAKAGGEGWLVPPAGAQFLGLKREEDQRWVMPKLRPHPARTFREAVQLRSDSPAVARSYINSIGDKAPGQPRSMQAEGIADYRELQTGHDAMVTAAQEVAALLRNAAPRS
jgi:pimeloyl-ACP methyl ester carboxylesterase